jgi:hypothetical protein
VIQRMMVAGSKQNCVTISTDSPLCCARLDLVVDSDRSSVSEAECAHARPDARRCRCR